MALQIAKTAYELHPTGVYTGNVYSVQFESSDYGPRVKMIIDISERLKAELDIDGDNADTKAR